MIKNINKRFYLFIFLCLLAHSFLTGITDIRGVVKSNFKKIQIETEYEYFLRINKPKQDIFISNLSDITLNVMKYTPYIMFAISKNPVIIPIYSFSIAFSSTICFVIKKVIKEPRPDDYNKKNSFPSGHSTIAFASFVCILLAFRKYKFGKIISFFVFFMALITAILRVLCHRHWIIDICFGSLIGCFISFLVYYFYVIKRKV